MKTFKPFILIFSAWGLIAIGRAENDAGQPGEFLNFGVGARPLGMGRSFTAVADDIDSVYWNPAGLSAYRSSQVEFEHAPLPLGGAHQYLAFSQPLYAAGNLGVGIVNLASGEIPRIDVSNPETEVGSYENRETGYLVSYAHRYGDKFGLGGTLKMADHTIDGRSARGYGADVGTLYDVTDKFRLGAMVRNLLPPQYKFDTDTEKFPTIGRAGASYLFFGGHLLTALDLEKTVGSQQGLKPHFGVEGWVIKNIFLRAGIDKSEITGGVGIRWKTIQFDYAAGFQDLGFLNRFSVKMFFGGYEVDVKASPEVFSPVGLKNTTTFHIDCRNRQRVVNWILAIKNAKGEVVRSYNGYNAPPETLAWDGKNSRGQSVPPGEYIYRMAVTDNHSRTETTPPRSIKVVSPTPLEIEAK